MKKTLIVITWVSLLIISYLGILNEILRTCPDDKDMVTSIGVAIIPMVILTCIVTYVICGGADNDRDDYDEPNHGL